MKKKYIVPSILGVLLEADDGDDWIDPEEESNSGTVIGKSQGTGNL